MTLKGSPRTVQNIKPSPKNPRKITPEELALLGDAMREFGDLSSIVVNRRTGRLVGGHQRVKNLNPAWKIEKRPAKDQTGTVALGHIRIPFGKWNYREVDWPEKQELAANLAANKISGEWDDDKLAALLREIDGSPLAELTGFDDAEIDKILDSIPNPDLEKAERTGARLSLLPYMGGKQMMVPRLIPLIPPHTAYVEVFGGGAALLLNKPPSQLEIYNDVDGELVNLFEVVRNDSDAFVKKADFLLYSRELNERWKKDLKDGKVPEDPVERALRFWYVIRSSFAQHPYKGWSFCETADRNRAEGIWNALIDMKPIHERLKMVEIDQLDFERLIKNRDSAETFFFLDPPYLGAEKYRMGVFTLGDHKRLLTALQTCKGKWLMTTGDHPDIRALFQDYSKILTTTTQSVAKKLNGETRDPLNHLLIANYPLPQQVTQDAKEA